ncbi:SPOR domain-containing protein [Desulfuromonas sp. AOP6]|uniref:SPOR domain-containing protein n=1 Tax=Desulfuromonas sp. AOP6 TaxID=1566351 RepID=UPI00128260A6|nr:SPOR domain-containing protein [Desulfuromonas sp. AOP6]BCA80418.1 hypothetical protein AOP6_2205 [Desulfuromonas sp. AOP6]
MRQIPSRSQRRIEKKQAVILLVLMLAVSLVSFVLGFMVGRATAPTDSLEVLEAPLRMPVDKKGEVGDEGDEGGGKPVDVADSLTFYDTLPMAGQTPLGSGINRPPSVKTSSPSQESPVTVRTPEKVTAAPQKTLPVAAPRTHPAGTHVVQVASFRSVEEADRLKDRLETNGYAVFLERGDLGSKGIWHRVLVGPFAGDADAQQVVERLKKEEGLSALVRRR